MSRPTLSSPRVARGGDTGGATSSSPPLYSAAAGRSRQGKAPSRWLAAGALSPSAGAARSGGGVGWRGARRRRFLPWRPTDAGGVVVACGSTGGACRPGDGQATRLDTDDGGRRGRATPATSFGSVAY